MTVQFQTLVFPILMMFVFFISALTLAYSQGSPQNIEVFYPIENPSPSPGPISPIPSISDLPGSEKLLDSSNDNNSTIAKAVAATAASTLVIAGIFFFFVRKYVIAQRKRERVGDSFQRAQPPRVPQDDFARDNGNIKGFIVDENGLDVLYWRQLQGGENKNGFHKEILNRPKDEEEGGMLRKGNRRSKKLRPVQEIHLLRGKSSTSHVPPPEDDDSSKNMGALPPLPSHGVALKAVEKREAPVQSKISPPASMQPPIEPPPPSLPIQNNNKSPATPLPAPPNRRTPAPPPPPVPAKSPAPPPPPVPAKSYAPPPNKAGGSATSLKPPPAARDKSSRGKLGASSGDGSMDVNNQVKLKPLHWDKVNKKNVDHSMVWDKINDGSFRFDGDLIEALFGYLPTSRNSPTTSSYSSPSSSSSSSQITILDARKSQNIAIVLKSLALSRRELLEALNEGQGLDADTVEKLMRIAPTEEEQSQILDFDGNPARLADAEAFLFHILKAVPSAFTRLNAMQFRANYDLEILHMKESLQTLELGCKELRSQRMFMKLLEAILKAGNRMNAGTARGNAQAFNLTTLLKLTDVKSTDGKTTLLHFVVEEVVRSEGKKCFISRSHSLSRSSSSSSRSRNGSSDRSTSKDDREKEYITLGLAVVGGLSTEFSNVKKAATIDINTFSGTCAALTARVAELKLLMLQCMADRKGGFLQEMKGFIDDAEEELKVIREEQNRVMDLVRRTKEYYQGGASKDPFQIFVIVRDFLVMFDQVCIEIARNQQRRKSSAANYGSKSPNSQESRTKMKFPILPASFMTDKSRSNSSDTDVDS